MIIEDEGAGWIAESRPIGDGKMELTFNDGRIVVRPMPVDHDGNRFMEIFPNHPETHHPASSGFYGPPMSTSSEERER